MAYPRFYLQVIVRVLLLAVSCMVFAFTWTGGGNYIALFNLGLLIVLQIFLFINYMNRMNRDLEHFFDSIKHEDSALSFNTTRRGFKRIYQSLVQLNDQIRLMRMRNAEQDQYFKTIVESIQTGLITFGPDQRIDIMNRAARNILGTGFVSKLDAFNTIQQGLGDILRGIAPPEKKLIRVTSGRDPVHLSVGSTILKLTDRELKIITLHDIQQELDRKELESWQKLIRIMNHEIMNSLAPIISTATTLRDYLSLRLTAEKPKPEQYGKGIMEKTISGLSIICERGEGLKNFVENYRSLNVLPQPVMTTFKVSELFEGCMLLLGEAIQSARITCITEIADPVMVLEADKSQTQQVLLNLVKNAVESLSETGIRKKVIRLKAHLNDSGKAVIEVSDNGKGIPPELMDQIFIPFFTTREKGSGIGLSVSRQIMHLHGGTLHVSSVPDKETVFTLTF